MNKIMLYTELAEWWPLLSDPADYEEEAELFRRAITEHSPQLPSTILELGSGGGNNASFLKKYFKLTLVDISPEMLGVSRKLNPECEHIQGDMRNVRLGTEYGVIFIHDAISYMSTTEQLAQAIETAFVHCRPGGMALFVPDDTKESFKPGTSHGGRDKGDRGIRYLDWTIDNDPNDEKYVSYMSYLLRTNDEIRQIDFDEHVCGLFAEARWLDMIRGAGFEPKKLSFDHSEFTAGEHSMFIGKKQT
jgi:SAM-dependent methyltransferase